MINLTLIPSNIFAITTPRLSDCGHEDKRQSFEKQILIEHISNSGSPLKRKTPCTAEGLRQESYSSYHCKLVYEECKEAKEKYNKKIK
eukprot:Pgem_evm1s8209